MHHKSQNKNSYQLMQPLLPIDRLSHQQQHHCPPQFLNRLEICTKAIERLANGMESLGISKRLFQKMELFFDKFTESRKRKVHKSADNSPSYVVEKKIEQVKKHIPDSFQNKNDLSSKKSSSMKNNECDNILQQEREKESNFNIRKLKRTQKNETSKQTDKEQMVVKNQEDKNYAQQIHVDNSIPRSDKENIEKSYKLENQTAKSIIIYQKKQNSIVPSFNTAKQIQQKLKITNQQYEQNIQSVISQQKPKNENTKLKNQVLVKQIYSVSQVVSDYKDNLINVQMIDFNKIIREARSSRQNINKSIPHQISETDNNLSIQNYDKIIKQAIQSRFNEEFTKFITRVFDNVCRSSFYGFINKSMDKTSTKVYFSRNCIHNVLKLSQQLEKRSQFKLNYIDNLLKMFNKQSIQSLKFLKLKYPQQQKILFDGEISNMIPRMDGNESHKKIILDKLGYKYLSGWKLIKQLINDLINQTNTKYELFEQNLKNLFLDKQNKAMSQKSQFSYQIGTKIKINTPKYTQEQILEEGLQIKSGEIMRIIIKWIDNIQQQLKQIMTTYAGGILEKKKYYQKDQNKQKNNILNNQNWLKEHQENGSEILSKFITKTNKQVVNSYLKQFKNVEQNEFKVNILTAVSSLGLENSVSNYLFSLLENINLFIKNVRPAEQVSFKIFDLFRGKCSGTYEQIKQVYENIKKSTIFQIIQVKNRINTPNRDYLLNMKMQGTAFVCQLQLHINTGSQVDQLKLHRGHCENDFNHFLYELERSKFGPLAEMVSVYSLNSDLPGFFDLNKINNMRNKLKKIPFDGSVSVSQSYELEIKIENQNIKYSPATSNLMICDFCFKIVNNFDTKCWISNNDLTVCEVCLVQKLRMEDKMKIFFKQYHTQFVYVPDAQENFANCYVTIDKISHKARKYCRAYHPVVGYLNVFVSMGSGLISDSVNNNLVSFKQKYLTENVFIFILVDQQKSIKHAQITQSSSQLSLMPFNDIKLLNNGSVFKHNKVEITYIQKQQMLIPEIYILNFQIERIKQTQEKSNILHQLKKTTLNGVSNLQTQFDYRQFRFIPLYLDNGLVHLKITYTLSNFPQLSTTSLKSLFAKIKCKFSQLEFKNLTLHYIRDLSFIFESTSNEEQVLPVHKLSSYLLQKLSLIFISINQLKIVYRDQNKPQMPNWTDTSTDLQQLQIKLYKCNQSSIQFTHLTNNKMKQINILNSGNTVLDLTKASFQGLKKIKLLNNANSGGEIRLKGFESKGVYFFNSLQLQLSQFAHSNLKHFPAARFDEFVIEKSLIDNSDQDCNEYPEQSFSHLKKLALTSNTYQKFKFDNLLKLKQLKIQGISCFEENKLCEAEREKQEITAPLIRLEQSNFIKELYSKGLWNIQKLTISNSRTFSDIFKIELNQQHQLYQLEQLQISNFNEIVIKTQLRNLKKMFISDCDCKSMNFSSILSTKFTQFKLIKCENLQSIELSNQIATSIKNMNLIQTGFPQFKKTPVCKNYFWSLEQIFIQGLSIRPDEIQSWKLMNVQKTQKQIREVLLDQKIIWGQSFRQSKEEELC